MTTRSIIVLGVLLSAGSFAGAKDLGYDDSSMTQLVAPPNREVDATWRHAAETVQPEQIFEQ